MNALAVATLPDINQALSTQRGGGISNDATVLFGVRAGYITLGSMAFDHLKESAQRSFADAAERERLNPERALAALGHAHEALASFHFANDQDADGFAELRKAVQAEVVRYEKFKAEVSPFLQYHYLVLALALGDAALARHIAAFQIERKNWSRLDNAVTYQICAVLGLPQTVKPPKGTFTDTEKLLLDALEAIARREHYDAEQVEKFWRTLRKKRYQFTVSEHKNLFTAALETLRAA